MASVSAVKVTTISRIDAPISATPTATLTALSAPSDQPRANGVSAEVIGAISPTKTKITTMKSTDVIAGGIAPSRKFRGRRTTRPRPRASRARPLTASETGFAIYRG